MKRLYLTVEGQTEAAFVRDVLTPHLANFNVLVHPPRLTGLHKRRVGKIPGGGLLGTFQHALFDMKTWTKEDKSPEARFSMMVDLYHLPRDFPGYEKSMERASGWEQAEVLERELSAVMNDERFLPYLQVHEFEALVLTEPLRLRMLYEVTDARIKILDSGCGKFSSPEEINHGQHTHPKSRIQQVIPEYDENIAGPLLAQDIGLIRIATVCPHFGGWLRRLESLDTESA